MYPYPTIEVVADLDSDVPCDEDDAGMLGCASLRTKSWRRNADFNAQTLSEHTRLEFIREIGFCHMRVLEGSGGLLQLSGALAKLCKINMKPELFESRGA